MTDSEANPSVDQLSIGSRIRLTSMPEDPDPIQPGELGTVTGIQPVLDFWQVEVSWDSGRKLSLVTPPDRFDILPSLNSAPSNQTK